MKRSGSREDLEERIFVLWYFFTEQRKGQILSPQTILPPCKAKATFMALHRLFSRGFYIPSCSVSPCAKEENQKIDPYESILKSRKTRTSKSSFLVALRDHLYPFFRHLSLDQRCFRHFKFSCKTGDCPCNSSLSETCICGHVSKTVFFFNH